MRIVHKKEQGGSIPDAVLSRINTSTANFVQRLKDANRKYIQDWEDPTAVATHKLGVATSDGIHFVYPEVQEINGQLIDFTNPKYSKWDAVDAAIERKDTIQFGKGEKALKEAINFTKNYKNYYPGFKKYQGGGIVKLIENVGKLSRAKDVYDPIVESTIHNLNKNNAWDRLQVEYANKNDLASLSKLRQLHFLSKAPNTAAHTVNGMPLLLWHGSDTPDIRIFNIGGRNRTSYTDVLSPRLYLTPDQKVAEQWAVDKDYAQALAIEHMMEAEMPLDYIAQRLRKSVKEIQNSIKKYNIGADFIRDNSDKSKLLYPLYAYFNKYVIADNNGKPIQGLEDFQKKAINESPAAIIKHVDERVSNTYGITEPLITNDFVVKFPQQVKSAAPLTFDLQNQLIPMSQRDNFWNQDINQ